jgi:hypothetical protein
LLAAAGCQPLLVKDASAGGAVIRHFAALSGFDADLPMLAKVFKLVGHSSVNACWKCAFQGRTGVDGVATVRLLGYCRPQKQQLPELPGGAGLGAGAGRPPVRSVWSVQAHEVHFDNPALTWTEAELAARAAAADDITTALLPDGAGLTPDAWRTAAAKARRQHIDLGCAGTTVFAQLPYYRCARAWPRGSALAVRRPSSPSAAAAACSRRHEHFIRLPVAHLLLYGIFQD